MRVCFMKVMFHIENTFFLRCLFAEFCDLVLLESLLSLYYWNSVVETLRSR